MVKVLPLPVCAVIKICFPSSIPRIASFWKSDNSKGYSINNIDSTIILQTPQINSYINKMRQNIANIFSIPIDDVSVKATTTDKLGFIGSGDGIAAMANVSISQSNDK